MNEAKAILSKALGIWGKGLKRLLGMLIVSNIASSQLLSLTFVLLLVLILKLGLHIIWTTLNSLDSCSVLPVLVRALTQSSQVF